MNQILDRVAVIASSAVTYLMALALGITAAAGEISQAAPEGGETVVQWAIIALTGISTAIAAIRRVTPVPPDERGILPPTS